MEEVTEFKYLGSVLYTHGGMEGEMKSRQVGSALVRVMIGRCVSMEIKKGIRNSIILPTVICIRNMDMVCSTATKNKYSGNRLY